jgi:hypothetical protein
MFLIPGVAGAQEGRGGQGIGIVTAIQGQATVSRASLPQPAALRFRDDVFFRDQIATKERATVRLLLGGKGTLTIREQSQVTLDESVNQDGSRQSFVGLLGGKIGAAIARALMRPGDTVEIRTPNAVAAVRGTVLIAEYIPPEGSAQAPQPILLASAAPGPLMAQAPGTGGTSNFIVVSGQVNVTIPGMPPLTLGPLQAVQITSTPAGIQPGAIQTLTQGQAAQAGQGLQTGKSHTGETGNTAGTQTQVAVNLANTIVQSTTGQAAETPAPAPATPSAITSTVAPVVPTVPPEAVSSTTNLVRNPGFETGTFADWTAAGAASVISSLGPAATPPTESSTPESFGFSPPEGNRMALIHTGAGATINPATELDMSTLSQSVQSLSPGSVYLVSFDYNFMSNEYPRFFEAGFNDTFEANLVNGEKSTRLATESVDTSAFKNAETTISGGGFSLSEDNGYIDFTSASKTVVMDASSATLEFKVFDVGDNDYDSGALIDKVSIVQDPPLYLLTKGKTLFRSDTTPLVEVSDQSRTFDSVLVSSGPAPGQGTSVSLGGPLFHARRATVDVPFSLLGLLDGSTLHTSSSKPLVWLEEGTYNLSTKPGTAIFDFWGAETAPSPETGVPVGVGKTVQHAGALLEASGGAAVNTHKVLKLDTALLEASAPIVRLVGSANAQTSLTTASTAMDLLQSKVTSLGPLVGLDKGILSITDGPLLRASHGSVVDVTGDLLSLRNGSKINVVNGPLIAVHGAGSLLSVSGSLVEFGGTGGNQIIVNNKIAPTAVLTQPGVNGIGVSATGGGSITIGPNPVKNPNLGIISATGSLIQATNGGSVKISAP